MSDTRNIPKSGNNVDEYPLSISCSFNGIVASILQQWSQSTTFQNFLLEEDYFEKSLLLPISSFWQAKNAKHICYNNGSLFDTHFSPKLLPWILPPRAQAQSNTFFSVKNFVKIICVMLDQSFWHPFDGKYLSATALVVILLTHSWEFTIANSWLFSQSSLNRTKLMHLLFL